jgi:chorismate mutase
LWGGLSRSANRPRISICDPARVCAQLERIDEARRTGELSEEEFAELENELLQRLMTRRC